MTTSPHSTLPLFDDSESSGSTPSAVGSPARTSASPARVPAWTVSAPGSGESFAVSLASFDPASSSWKMSGLFEGADSLPFSETLPRSGMVLSGTLFLLPPLVHLTSVIASGSSRPLSTPTATMGDRGGRGDLIQQLRGNQSPSGHYAALLPTPTAKLGDERRGFPSQETAQKRYAQGRRNLDDAIALLPTPTANDYGSQNNGHRADGSTYRTAGKPSLSTMARRGLIPTPTAGDASASGSRNTATSKAHPGISLTDWAIGDGGTGRLLPTPQAEDHRNCADYSDGSRKQSPQLRHLGKGRLNPRFVEWMQGFPLGWTEL